MWNTQSSIRKCRKSDFCEKAYVCETHTHTHTHTHRHRHILFSVDIWALNSPKYVGILAKTPWNQSRGKWHRRNVLICLQWEINTLFGSAIYDIFRIPEFIILLQQLLESLQYEKAFFILFKC